MENLKPFIFQDDMLFGSQFVRVRVGRKNKSYYERLLDETLSPGQEIDVPVGWLPKNSKKAISVVCPRCEKVREVVFQNLVASGYSFCWSCAKRKNYTDMLGKTFGRLTVLRFGSGVLELDGTNVSTFICTCECGEEVEVRSNDVRRGTTTSCGCYQKERTFETLYNVNISDKERIDGRFIPEYKEWRKNVFDRDSYTCKSCSKIGGNLVAHHIVPYSTNKKLRFDVNNGITLCRECHKEFHINFMGGYKVKCNSSDLFTFIVLKKKSNP